MPTTFPNDSTDYRNARNALSEEEVALRTRIEAVDAIKSAHGWKSVTLVSAQSTSYQTHDHGQNEDGEHPMMNVFIRDGETNRHFWATEMQRAPTERHPRHMDLAGPIWNIFDMTPKGRSDFFPSVLDA